MTAKCPACGRVVGCHVPRGGDGSAVRLRSHTRPDDGRLCGGHRIVDLAETTPIASAGSAFGPLDSDGHDGHAPQLNGLLADCPGCVTASAVDQGDE